MNSIQLKNSLSWFLKQTIELKVIQFSESQYYEKWAIFNFLLYTTVEQAEMQKSKSLTLPTIGEFEFILTPVSVWFQSEEQFPEMRLYIEKGKTMLT